MVRTNAAIRSSVNGSGFVSKMVDFNKGERNVKKNCAIPFSPMSKFPRSKSVIEREQRIPRTHLQTAVGKEEFDSPSQAKKHKSGSLQQSRSGCAKFSEKAAGEVMQNRETSQKVALQALRDASATENLVRVLKTFSDLSRSARADASSAEPSQI
ncbi:hypothetical protein GIB67_036677 [Kingdonia uniflora]|uniref:DUF6857 domain-containing protein n=1 Tax=Kingdonia uniflora TaxID=39325 RepID=A0A7J7LWM9_9MAGN|nr:hypothetical protein GIB67_036677 [Kingdonia uniflora]